MGIPIYTSFHDTKTFPSEAGVSYPTSRSTTSSFHNNDANRSIVGLCITIPHPRTDQPPLVNQFRITVQRSSDQENILWKVDNMETMSKSVVAWHIQHIIIPERWRYEDCCIEDLVEDIRCYITNDIERSIDIESDRPIPLDRILPRAHEVSGDVIKRYFKALIEKIEYWTLCD